MEYPLKLQKGDKIMFEKRFYTVHSIDSWIEEKYGIFHNRVGIETTIGTYLTVPISQQLERTA